MEQNSGLRQQRKKRIAIFQEDLQAGGIQKSLYNLLQNLDYDRVDVSLFLFEEGSFFPGRLPGALEVHLLKKPPRYLSFLPFRTAQRLWKEDLTRYGNFDVAADFNSYQFGCAAGALRIPADRHVMWIHNNVEIKYRSEWKYRVLWRCFRGKLGQFDGFVPCSDALREPFIRMSGRKDAPLRTIANYIDVGEIRGKQRLEPEVPQSDFWPPAKENLNFAALGRLCHQKGYDRMITLFSRASVSNPRLRLYIIGDGPDRAPLEKQAKEALPGKIHFLGAKQNPYAILDRMDAFLSTSRYEGQPLNIEEARVIGLPIYCTKNLEAYSRDIRGYDDDGLVEALASARRQEKHPNDLEEYNRAILESIYAL
ncbi:MAG: glycosyltransferase [Oscillospiraceae bacterium]|nr:glycosyltransferase [Oscillospiraceae bacterium]